MTETILLVEDEEYDVFFMMYAMKKAGVTNPVHVAKDGREALDYLQGNGKFGDRSAYPVPYLVLLDLKLPHVMGLEILKWIRQQSQLPVIVIILTSSKEPADISSAYRLGANAYLVKTPDVGHLTELIRAINDFWLKQNVPPCLP